MSEAGEKFALEELPRQIRERIEALCSGFDADDVKVWMAEERLNFALVWEMDAIAQSGEAGEYSAGAVVAENTEAAITRVEQVSELKQVTVRNVHTSLERVRVNASLSFKA